VIESLISLFTQLPTFALLWVLPGLAWSKLLPHRGVRPPERWVLALGLNFVVTPVLTLLLAYLPGPLTSPQLLLGLLVATFGPLLIGQLLRRGRAAERASEPSPWGRRGRLLLAAVLLLAAGLRFVNLGYSEFQGDEAIVIVRAAKALEGDEAILFQHKKGPAELTVVMATWRLTGFINEPLARLPFAWANLLGVAALFLIGRRVGGRRLGLLAAALIAVEGYLVAFGRIAQYQSLVFALSALGLLALLAYEQGGGRGLVPLAAALFAGGFLAHYDAALALPAGLFLMGARLWRERGNWRQHWPVPLAGLLGLALVALFYGPFLQSGYVDFTSDYIAKRVGSTRVLYNHLRNTFELSTVYDSVYLLGLLAFALSVRLLVLGRRRGRSGAALAALLLLLAGTAFVWPALWERGEVTLAWLPYTLLLVGGLWAPGESAGERALWLWLGVPALFYLFFVELPFTHIHTAFAPWALVAGMGLLTLGEGAPRLPLPVRRLVGGATALLLALIVYYPVLIFVDHTPEYRRTFPRNRSPFYPTPYEEIPEHGLFGFPYRAGWKTVGRLMQTGELAGPYISNEEPPITDYYLHDAARWPCPTPNLYITAVDVQDELYIRWDQVNAPYYPPDVVVNVQGTPKLTVHRLGGEGVPTHYEARVLARAFDRTRTPDRLAEPVPTIDLPTQLPEGLESVELRLGDFARLEGYTLDTAEAHPGGYVDLTLVWEVLAGTESNYNVFTHLYDGEGLRGQLDGQPVCGTWPTPWWEAGQTVVDFYRVPILPDAAPGSVPLLVGMYDVGSGERLPVTTPSGEPLGDHIHLTDLTIRRP
jgi:4-amino-4-deoxy-L-arabinose transferase-like glycosyltransferase